MYPLYVGEEQRSLEVDDIAGLCFLYPTDPCPGGCAEGQACTYDGCVASCAGAVCTSGARCGVDGCTLEPCAPGSCEVGCEATCDPSLLSDGDPCEADSACLSGHCSPSGLCAAACVDGACAGADFYCDANPAVPLCLSTLGSLGQGCDSGDDCQSTYCLSGATPAPICTRSCTATDQACPHTMTCEVVDEVDVCVPATVDAGCAVGGRGRGRGAAPALLLLLLMLVPLFRRKGHGR